MAEIVEHCASHKTRSSLHIDILRFVLVLENYESRLEANSQRWAMLIVHTCDLSWEQSSGIWPLFSLKSELKTFNSRCRQLAQSVSCLPLSSRTNVRQKAARWTRLFFLLPKNVSILALSGFMIPLSHLCVPFMHLRKSEATYTGHYFQDLRPRHFPPYP